MNQATNISNKGTTNHTPLLLNNIANVLFANINTQGQPRTSI